MIYLYVKQHPVTGLKYFGKTIRKDPVRYQGSGVYWKNHLKTHGGRGIKTIELYSFENESDCTSFALDYSKKHNIVESSEWANLVDETGLDSCVGGHKGHKHTEEAKRRIGQAARERSLNRSPEWQAKITAALVGRKVSDETRRKQSEAAKRRHLNSRKSCLLAPRTECTEDDHR